MNNIKAKQYSQAIYEIAKENNLEKDYLELSLAIIDVGNHDPNLFNYLGSPDVNHEDKKNLLKEIVEDKNNYYIHWLFILIDSGRTKYLSDYIKDYINLYNKEHGIVKGYAWTTEPIDQKTINKLQELMSKKVDKEVMIENRIDKTIIGGIKLEVGDNIWDNTIKNKLLQLLKEGSEKNE